MTPANRFPTRTLGDFLAMEPLRLFGSKAARLFEEPFTMFRPFLPMEENWPLSAWTPACDIFETEKEVVLKVELPEVKKEDVHVTVVNNVLTLKGERKLEEKKESENFFRMERRYGEFIRGFTMPAFVDAAKINAEFKDGVLTVKLPKHEEALPKQIDVRVN